MIRSGEALDQDSVENGSELEDIPFEATTDADARQKPSRDGEPDTQKEPAQGGVSGAQKRSGARGQESGCAGTAQGEEGAGGRLEPSAEPTTEQTDQGAQAVIPGAENDGGKSFVEAQVDKRVKGTKAQKPADEGLFDVAARGQRKLFSLPGAPARSALTGKDPVPIVVARRRFSKQLSIRERRRASRQHVRTLKGAYLNRDTGETIRLGAEGADKMTSGNRTALDPNILAAMPEIVETAVHVEAIRDKQKRPGVSAFHVFYSAARVDDRLAKVRFVVREDQNGNFVYDSHGAELKGPGVLAAGSVPPRRSSTLAGPPGPTINVGSLLQGVKYSDGSPVISEEAARLSSLSTLVNRRFKRDASRIGADLQASLKQLAIASAAKKDRRGLTVLGVTGKDLQRSTKRAHPPDGIPTKHRVDS